MEREMITVNDDYLIEADEENYIVYRKRIISKKDSKNYGKDAIVFVGYYRSLTEALTAIMHRMERDAVKDGSMTLESAVNEIRRIHDDYQKLLKKTFGNA